MYLTISLLFLPFVVLSETSVGIKTLFQSSIKVTGKSSAVTVINVATLESNSPIYAWWMALLFAMRLHVKGRFPVIIYKSRKGL